ncbi:hypothetical protein E5D57_008209 [Metarhizium anisopliae]|nr:hypothetical protein E5D57_008209 [Metarhizium anisopliae]
MYLLGNYFSVVSSTVEALLQNGAGHIDSQPPPTNHFMKVRRKIFGKVMRLSSSVESHIMWQRWEPSIGGSFPDKTYEEVFACNTHITGYLMLMSYALAYTPLTDKAGDTYYDNEKAEQDAAGVIEVQSESRDSRERRPNAKVLQRVELTHHTVLSTLTMLSNALLSGQRLPPLLPMPRHYETARNLIRLSEIDTIRESTGHDNSTLSDLYSSNHGVLALRMIDLRQGRRNRAAKQVIKRDGRVRSGEMNGASSSNPKVNDPLSMKLRVYLLTQVCGALVCDELEDLARAVSRLVGIVDFSFSIDAGNGDVDVDGDRESQAVERPLSESSAVASGGKGKAVMGPQPSWS